MFLVIYIIFFISFRYIRPKRSAIMNNIKFKNSSLGNYYEWAGALMITAAFVLFISEGYKIVFGSKPDPTAIVLINSHQPNYNLIYDTIRKQKQTDSFHIAQIKERDDLLDSVKLLNRKIEEVQIDNSDTENKVKIVASIIAVIVAAVGFFGFKSLNDIREHTIKNSQIDAQQIAKEIAEETSKETLEYYRSTFEELKPLINSIESTLSSDIQFTNKQINELTEDLAALLNRVQVLEENQGDKGGMDIVGVEGGPVNDDEGDNAFNDSNGGIAIGGVEENPVNDGEGDNAFNADKTGEVVANKDKVEKDSFGINEKANNDLEDKNIFN